MTEPQNQPQTGGGTDKLPQPWAIAVQLIGTFGLAVFLVVYYVLVMQPKEAARYDELKASVDNLASLVENQQALIGRDQESGLEQLFILGVVHDIADYIGRERQSKEEDLKREIENILYNRTRLVTGYKRKDGRIVSERFSNRIRESGVAAVLAHHAVQEWKAKEKGEIETECLRILSDDLFKK